MDIYSNNNQSGEENKNEDSKKNESNNIADSKLSEIELKLQSQRDEWGQKIVELIKQINDVNGLSDAQVHMLSYRQIIVEQLTKFRIRLKKTQTTYEKKFKSSFIGYYNYDYKISDKHKTDMVNADLYFYRRQMGLLEAQIEFFKESILTLDKMGYAIKNRVNFEEI